MVQTGHWGPWRVPGRCQRADERQFAVIYPKFKEQAERGLPVLTGEIDRKLPPDAKNDAREKLAKRQANAAVALLRMNQPAKVWPLLKRTPPDDPRVRSYLIHRFGPLGADAGAIIKRLDEEPDVTIRRALLVSLGEYGEQELSSDTRKALLPKLQDIYRKAPDPGLHASAEWLLRTWHQEAWLKQVNDGWAKDKEQREKHLESIRQFVTKDKEKAPPQWYVTAQGQTMVVIPGPVEFRMGSPLTEAGRELKERQHRKRIGRSFAIAGKPVTVKQYLQFRNGHDYLKQYAPTEDCPVHLTTWYMAAAYCNWLSEQEGIPKADWSFETNPQGQVRKLKENYLSLTGYRLPTEAEWEYACRAGAVTSQYCGESEELLRKYGWFLQNAEDHSWPVGSKKPNDLGLFDLHGNVFAWYQESYEDYPEAKNDETIEDKEGILTIASTADRVLRGGSFFFRGSLVRSAYRVGLAASVPTYFVGFRPARTFR